MVSPDIEVGAQCGSTVRECKAGTVENLLCITFRLLEL